MKFSLLLSLLLANTITLAQTAIDSEETILIGGIHQYITLKSKDKSLPLLLFLHGGPGGSVMHYAEKFTDKLQEHFVVIQWDQRETGKTRALNASVTPLSLALYQNDTHELIRALLKRFQRDKLYLAGHSWGTALGFDIARKYPDLLYAYIAMGAMINQLESERIALTLMKDEALKAGNKKASVELDIVHIPFENGEQLYFHRRWLLHLSHGRKPLLKSYVEAWSRTWLNVFNEASADNLMESLPEIGCPVYFFAGRNDLQTNSVLAEEYYRLVRAPKKGFFWFELSAHSIPSSEPEHLQETIIEKILPETFTIQKAQTLISDH